MDWRNLPDYDYFLYARSFHAAARKFARAIHLDAGPVSEFDLCPVLSMYRRAVELHLKVMILGKGGNFLTRRPDELSVQKSRSLSWLAQFVTQIITVLKWECEFQCEGIHNLADFKRLIGDLNGIDPEFEAFRVPVNLGYWSLRRQGGRAARPLIVHCRWAGCGMGSQSRPDLR